jgi:hypothetical protein
MLAAVKQEKLTKQFSGLLIPLEYAVAQLVEAL